MYLELSCLPKWIARQSSPTATGDTSPPLSGLPLVSLLLVKRFQAIL
jgi:hypothetical protein